MLFNMGYCDNHRVFTRHSSHRRSLRHFGYNDAEVSELAAYRYDADDNQRQLGHSHLQWAAPCESYKEDCVVCEETYQAVRSADAARRAACFAEGVLAAGDKLFMVSLPVPSVAVRSDRKSDYRRHRLGSYAKLRKRKVKRSAEAFQRKCEHMESEEGLKPHPRYFQQAAIEKRKSALSAWLSENKDAHYQLECWREGIIQSVVVSKNKFIPRSRVTKGWRYEHRGDGRVSADVSADVVKGSIQRMSPPLLRWCLKQFEKRMRQVCDFKYIAVMERGRQGMFHYHMLLHVYGHVPEDLESQLREAWFAVTGNIHYEDAEGGSWFSRVHNASQAAAYVSKYLSKGWFSRRQTSNHLNLTDAVRDSRLIEYGFLQGDVASNFERHQDGFLTYISPFEDEDIESAGTREWVGVSIDMLAPKRFAHAAAVNIVAVFRASQPCRHPASAISGACYSPDGLPLDVIPQAWWFPLSSLSAFVGAGAGTAQISKLKSLLNKIRLGGVIAAHQAGYESDDRLDIERHDEARAMMRGIFSDSRFPLHEQYQRMQASLDSFPGRVTEAFKAGPSAAEDAELAHEHGRLSRCNDAVFHRGMVERRRARLAARSP